MCIKRMRLLLFLKFWFYISTNVWNRCHDLLMMSINLNGIAILNNKSSDKFSTLSLISKTEAINLM